jgi:hypothetical protein
LLLLNKWKLALAGNSSYPCSSDLLAQTENSQAHPQAKAAAMRLLREYVNFYYRNCSYLPARHGVREVVSRYAEQHQPFPDVSARVMDMFFLANLPGRSIGNAQEFIDLDCGELARQTRFYMQALPAVPDTLLRQVLIPFFRCSRHAFAPGANPLLLVYPVNAAPHKSRVGMHFSQATLVIWRV